MPPVRRKLPPDAGPESSFLVDSGLSIRGLLIGSVDVQSPFKQVASLKCIFDRLCFRRRFGSGFKRTVGFCLLVPKLTFRCAVTASTSFCAAKQHRSVAVPRAQPGPPQTFEVRAADEQRCGLRQDLILLLGRPLPQP